MEKKENIVEVLNKYDEDSIIYEEEIIKKVFYKVFDKVYNKLKLIKMENYSETINNEIKKKVFDKVFDKVFNNVYLELEKTEEDLFFLASKLLDEKDERSRKMYIRLRNGKSIIL